MATDQLICANCGAGISPAMSACPKCGEEQIVAPQNTMRSVQATGAAATPALDQVKEETPVEAEQAPSSTDQTSTNTETILPLQHPTISRVEAPLYPSPQAVFLAPEDEPRRFPLLTRQQLVLIAVGIAFILFLVTIGYLLWRQQQADQRQLTTRQATLPQPRPAATLSLMPTPMPTSPDDNAITESVKSALIAYGGQGVVKYEFEVKNGIVTLNGEAKHVPEKEGAERVVKGVAGVKDVVNRLNVKGDAAFLPVKLNEAEAKRLEDALLKQLQATPAPPNEEARKKPAQLDTQRDDAERQRREQAAAKQREEEAALRKAAEERLRREVAEFERQQQEQQRTEAEKRTRAEQARLEASTLRSGTIAWSGVVEGVDEIVIAGSNASVRHVSGGPPREIRASFSASLPRAPVSLKLLSTSGRGTINIIQEPSAANGYTAIVRIDDSGKGGNKRHEFTLRWSAQ